MEVAMYVAALWDRGYLLLLMLVSRGSSRRQLTEISTQLKRHPQQTHCRHFGTTEPEPSSSENETSISVKKPNG